MNELEKIQYARYFIEKLANGINPIDGQNIPKSDTLNNIRISRCLFYVSDLLRQIVDNGGIHPDRSLSENQKVPFSISAEQLLMFPYSDAPIPVSEISRRINTLIDTEKMRRMTNKDITNWLLTKKMIHEIKNEEGNLRKRPTEEGMELGISVVERQNEFRIYHFLAYDFNAQHFIIDNMDAILSLKYGTY